MMRGKKRASGEGSPKLGDGLELLGVGGLGFHLFSLPPDLYNYILRLAVLPPSGRQSLRKAEAEYRIVWETLAALRLTRKPKPNPNPNPNNRLNALFYEATLRRWTHNEIVAFLQSKPSMNELKCMHRRMHALRHATTQACGADNAAWKRALAAYKSYHSKHPDTSAEV